MEFMFGDFVLRYLTFNHTHFIGNTMIMLILNEYLCDCEQ